MWLKDLGTSNEAHLAATEFEDLTKQHDVPLSVVSGHRVKCVFAQGVEKRTFKRTEFRLLLALVISSYAVLKVRQWRLRSLGER